MRPILLAAAAALSGCATFPQLQAEVDPAAARAPSPALVPLGPVLAAADGLSPVEPAGIEARAAALRARAAALRGWVIEPAALATMQRGVDTSRVAAPAPTR